MWRDSSSSSSTAIEPSVSEDADLNPVEIASLRRQACLMRVGALDCMEDGLLGDFQTQVMELLRQKNALLESAIPGWTGTLHNLLMFEFKVY